MKVIICGAGQVGWQIARHLSGERNDVTVVDQDPELVRRATDSLDVQGVAGFASYPDILERAGARDADMIIAATHSDEVNMVTCQVAHSVFGINRKIARLRSQSYLDAIYSDLYRREHMPIDVVISPEREVAAAALQRLSAPAAFDTERFMDGQAQLLGILIEEECPVVHTPLRQLTDLFSTLRAVVVGVRREGVLFAPNAGDQLFVGDECYVFELTDDFGTQSFAAGNTGVQMGGWFNKKIRSANDLKGLKMRMPGLGGQVLGKLGGSPSALPGGQIYENLVSGAIDATEWVGPWNDEAMKFHEAAKYYYYPGMHEPGSTLACGVNKSWFTSLTKSDQLIIKTACDWADTTTMAEYNAKNGAALNRLVNENGVKLEKFSDKVYDAFAKGAAEVYDEVQQHSALAKKVHGAFIKGRKEIGAWTNLSDSPYISQRNRALGL